MDKVVFVGDIIEGNGLTIKQNNLATEHAIPIGTLVEIVDEEEDSCIKRFLGVRMFIASHSRDCDGEPLYSLTHDRDMCDDKILNDGYGRPRGTEMIPSYRRTYHQGSFGNESLKIITLPT